ncbi:hypothetical protein ANCDUO_05105 [Ancylostoma duodenale]|uniref:Uncharacterized protein n=1 Tax=Ancylostoma duodenale TaxID=51022 RepID=A0A0C2H5A4_9BILA|nr:hypothetical protein ANCDUO_05105 [Ancylostoma duodenale]
MAKFNGSHETRSVDRPDQICVSNPLVEMFKLFLISDRSFLNRSVDEITLGQLSDAFQLDSGGMTHLLGGVTLDNEKRVAGKLKKQALTANR